MATLVDAPLSPTSGDAQRWSRRVATVIVGSVVVLTGACGNSRDAGPGEETVPRITAAPTSSTVAQSTEPATTTTTTSPTTTPATAGTTNPPIPQTTPWPTSLRTDPPTNPPVTNPPQTNPPVTNPPVAQATTQPSPTAFVAATPSGPTSTLVVSPAAPVECTPASIGTDTGQLTITGLSCNAGWAVGLVNECPSECEGRDVFHITSSGWVHDGYFPAICAEGLTGAGMSIHTAASFSPTFCADPPGPTAVIRPDSTGESVIQLQTALVAEGYQISVDGSYGPRTQAAVRDFQTRNGLVVDGIAGPRTQAALGIGPDGEGSTSPTSPPSPTPPPSPASTATTLPAAATTVVVAPGTPATCTAEAIGADIGRTVDVISVCRSGWAVGQINNCAQAPCPTVDVFHITDQGWVYDARVGAGCAEELHDAGMSAYTAGDFSPWCGVPNLPAQRLVIRPGSTGVAVTQLQIALVALGYPVAVDGTYGPGTEAALRDFQADNGLAVDGIAGPDTRTALGL